MAERGILFSAPMVRALLDGRKTQTRRLLKPPRGLTDPDDPDHWWVSYWNRSGVEFVAWPEDKAVTRKVPFPHAIGDLLYVREACRAVWHPEGNNMIGYGADNALIPIGDEISAGLQWDRLWDYGKPPGNGKTVPSIHCPRWVSRLDLTVTDVRVQRVQEISEEDAVAEGLHVASVLGPGARDAGKPASWMPYPEWEGLLSSTAVECYAKLWDTLHTKPGDRWDDNPWVVAYTFTVERRSIGG